MPCGAIGGCPGGSAPPEPGAAGGWALAAGADEGASQAASATKATPASAERVEQEERLELKRRMVMWEVAAQ